MTGVVANELPIPGLSPAEVAARVASGQTNAFSAPTSRSIRSIVRANVLTLFNGIIALCFITLFVIGRWQDALFGLSAFSNTIIGSVQEFRAKRALDKLVLLHAPLARVVRRGEVQEIAVSEVVLDDILVLLAGDQVPADAVVVSRRGLELDESLLTGESDPVEKSANTEVLSGSVVVAGSGIARVVRVGGDSYANRLSNQAKAFSLVTSELRTGINRILKWVSWIIAPVALLVVNAQMVALGGWNQAIESGAWRDATVGTIAAVVAMIPLGLVLMTSIAFAVGAVRLSQRNVLVQELAAVEGLARIDVICLDKTGTLTSGDIVFDQVRLLESASDTGWGAVLGWFGSQPDANATARCLSAEYPPLGTASIVSQESFSSERKWSAVEFAASGVVADSAGGAGHTNGHTRLPADVAARRVSDSPSNTWVLGAPEMVLAVPVRGVDVHRGVREQAAQLASTGLRTLVLANTTEPLRAHEQGADPESGAVGLPVGLGPVALLTFRELIRPDAGATLDYFAEQGVSVRIISGDSPLTVAAIAREVGLEVPQGFDARELPEDLDAIAEVLEHQLVFGRVTPEQKLIMVRALQGRGHAVAMIGDGVNDALAIKEADIGIAMESGSAATKAVARIVLLDGKFASLPAVVDEGRRVIANIERVSMLFLTKTAYATALAVLFGALLLQFPLLPRQLSVSDALTIGIPAFVLALLPSHERYLPGFLRRSLSFAIPSGLVVAGALTAFSCGALALGVGQAELRTGATLLLTLVGLRILTVLSPPIRGVKIALIAAMVLGFVLVYSVPVVSGFLQLMPMTSVTVTLIAVCAIAALVGIEIVRFWHQSVLVRRRAGQS